MSVTVYFKYEMQAFLFEVLEVYGGRDEILFYKTILESFLGKNFVSYFSIKNAVNILQ